MSPLSTLKAERHAPPPPAVALPARRLFASPRLPAAAARRRSAKGRGAYAMEQQDKSSSELMPASMPKQPTCAQQEKASARKDKRGRGAAQQSA